MSFVPKQDNYKTTEVQPEKWDKSLKKLQIQTLLSSIILAAIFIFNLSPVSNVYLCLIWLKVKENSNILV